MEFVANKGFDIDGVKFPICYGDEGELVGVEAAKDFPPYSIVAKIPVN